MNSAEDIAKSALPRVPDVPVNTIERNQFNVASPSGHPETDSPMPELKGIDYFSFHMGDRF